MQRIKKREDSCLLLQEWDRHRESGVSPFGGVGDRILLVILEY